MTLFIPVRASLERSLMMRHSRQTQLLGALMVPILLAATTASARLLEVKQDGTKEYSVLQDALSAAATGDTILIHPGNYQNWTERYHGGALRRAVGFIESGVTIMAETYAVKIIPPDMVGGVGLYSVTSDSVMISGLRVVGANSNDGISLAGGGAARIERCLIEACASGVVSGGLGTKAWVTTTHFVNTTGMWCAAESWARVWNCDIQNYSGRVVRGLVVGSAGSAQMSNCRVSNAELVQANSGGVAVVRGTECIGGRSGALVRDPGSSLTMLSVSMRGEFRGGAGAVGISAKNLGTLRASQIRVEGYEWGVQLQSPSVVQLNESHILDWTEWAAIAQFNTDPPSKIWDLTGNWWGTADSTAIAEAIWDGHDDPVGSPHGFIEFWPAATQRVPVQQRSVGRMKGFYKHEE